MTAILKRALFFSLILIVLIFVSCEKSDPQVSEESAEKQGLPQIVETELLELIGRGWDSLSTDLQIYDTYISEEGEDHGYGPNGRYYDWDYSFELGSLFTLNFRVDDQLRMKVSGKLIPVSWTLEACDTKIVAVAMRRDSVKYIVENFALRTPEGFLQDSDARAVLSYGGSDVGYVSKESFEDESYMTEEYYVLHYYRDHRTFAINAEGLYY